MMFKAVHTRSRYSYLFYFIYPVKQNTEALRGAKIELTHKNKTKAEEGTEVANNTQLFTADQQGLTQLNEKGGSDAGVCCQAPCV